MRYSNKVEVIAMILLWAAVLIWYDIAFNKHFFAPTTERVHQLSSPQVLMWIPHIGCAQGKADELQRTLQSLPWLKVPTIKQPSEMAAMDPAMAMKPGSELATEAKCGLGVLAEVQDVAKADFIALRSVMARIGVVPTMLEFGGIPHFALKAKVANLACDSCMEAAMGAFIAQKDPRFGTTFKWLDSRRVNAKEHTITAFVRYNSVAHIEEMLRALEHAGFAPESLQIVLQ